MTLYVDPLREYPRCRLRQKRWCHLMSDGDDAELHEFAAKLGLKRKWCQREDSSAYIHYDLTPSRRTLAVIQGAVTVSSREMVRLCIEPYMDPRQEGEGE